MKPAHRVPRLPLVLLAALSLISFAGPFGVIAVIGGGESPRWPPDRPVEWVAVALLLALFLVFFLACVSVRLWYLPRTRQDPLPEPVGRDDDVER